MNTIFGLTEAQITAFGMSYGLGFLMLTMLMIVGKLAWDCKAGKFGTLVLFIGLALGLVGFIAKLAIQQMIGIH